MNSKNKIGKQVVAILTVIICIVFAGCARSNTEETTTAVSGDLDEENNDQGDSSYEGIPVTDGEAFTYEETDGGMKITGYSEDYGLEVVIPSEIEGKTVAAIGEKAFASCDNIVSITMPDKVTEIGEFAFAWCSNLETVTLSNGLASIGANAFLFDVALSEISIPEGVTSIETCTFSQCTYLKTVVFPDSLTTIGEKAFNECTRLDELTVSPNVTSIADDAFENCKSTSWYTVLGSYVDEYATNHGILHVGTSE